MKKRQFMPLIAAAGIALSAPLSAEEYLIDTQGAHAFVQFKISHLGYSWVIGRFNDFRGSFSYYEQNPAASKVSVTINTASVDSNHAERDKHLRSADFFEVKRFPEAHFTLGQPFTPGSTAGTASGMLTIKGIAKEEKIQLTARREGKTLRLEGKAAIDRTAYGIYYNSPSFFEGLKQEAIANDFELAFKLVFEEMEKE